LLIFDADWRNSALGLGRKIPLVGSLLPEPATPEQSVSPEEVAAGNARERIREPEALLAERESALREATDKVAQQERQIGELTARVEELTRNLEDRTISAEEYESRIRSLADMYGKMTPSKAAPILEQMTTEEASLVLGAMSDNVRSRILERMSPQRAADVTMMLKDADSVEDREIAALQARVRELEQRAGAAATALDDENLGNTFAAMEADQAAALLLELSGTNRSKALRILSAMNDAARSRVLGAMAKEDSKKTAELVDKLLPANP
jgi:flagellar motility protein MotE (MotC chaperone)